MVMELVLAPLGFPVIVVVASNVGIAQVAQVGVVVPGHAAAV
jgi:hypothetical protein